jgi:hypothetical protein
MSTLRLVILLVGIGLFWRILRPVLRSWLGGPSREDMLKEIDSRERGIELAAGGTAPACPVCGAPTLLHTYSHITLWRCSEYPRCRGFVKAKKASQTEFAKDWDRKRKKGI